MKTKSKKKLKPVKSEPLLCRRCKTPPKFSLSVYKGQTLCEPCFCEVTSESAQEVKEEPEPKTFNEEEVRTLMGLSWSNGFNFHHYTPLKERYNDDNVAEKDVNELMEWWNKLV